MRVWFKNRRYLIGNQTNKKFISTEIFQAEILCKDF